MTSNTTHKKRDLGFTLIELLVVVSIIGVLSSVTMASLSSARKKAKETKYTQNLLQLRNAMALYVTSNGSVPCQDSNCWADDYNGGTSLRDMFAPLVAGKFIPAISAHPDWPGNNESYTQYNTAYVSSYSSYGYMRACGEFSSFDEAVRTGQKGILMVADGSANPFNLRLEDTISYCNNWGGGPGSCYSYDGSNWGYKYYCVPL